MPRFDVTITRTWRWEGLEATDEHAAEGNAWEGLDGAPDGVVFSDYDEFVNVIRVEED